MHRTGKVLKIHKQLNDLGTSFIANSGHKPVEYIYISHREFLEERDKIMSKIPMFIFRNMFDIKNIANEC